MKKNCHPERSEGYPDFRKTCGDSSWETLRMTFAGRTQKGLTVIELVIVLAVLLLAVGAIVTFQTDFFSIGSFLEKGFTVQRDTERVIDEIVEEIRTAGQSEAGGYPLEITASTSLAFYANIDKDAAKERIHYFLNGSDLWKSVVQPAGQPATYATSTATETLVLMLRNVITNDTPQIFSYYDSNYAGTTTPITQPVNVLSIRLIGISITVDEDTGLLPPPITVSSQVTIRNLKDNL